MADTSEANGLGGAETMSEPELRETVREYLHRRGYTRAEAALLEEEQSSSSSTVVHSLPELGASVLSPGHASAGQVVSHYSKEETLSPTAAYETAYSALSKWCDNSLEIYRGELCRVLYPLYVHAYLRLVLQDYADDAREFLHRHAGLHPEHVDEIQRLHAIITPAQVHSDPTSQLWRSNRYNLVMTAHGFELLNSFLQQNNSMALLSIMNQYLNIKVLVADQSLSAPLLPTGNVRAAEAAFLEYCGLPPLPSLPDVQSRLDLHKTRPVYWGLIKDSLPEKALGGVVADPSLANVATGPVPPRSLAVDSSASSLTDTDQLRLLENARKRVRVTSISPPSICFFTFLNTHDELKCVATSSDASKVAGGFNDSTVRLFNLERNSSNLFNVRAPTAEDWEQYSVTTPFQPQSQNDDPSPIRLLGHSGPVYGMDFSPDGKFLLSASDDTTARLWDLNTNRNLVVYKGHNYPVWDVSFSQLGYYFATASHDRTARLWSTDHVHPLRIFAGHLSDVHCVEFHPNSSYVATGSSDKSVRLWEVQTGECVRVFTGHQAPIYCLAFSPDGRLLASAGEDQVICLWDLGSGRRIQSFRGHSGMVHSLSFSQEGLVLASGGSDRTVRLWDLAEAVKDANERPKGVTVVQKYPSKYQLAAYPTKRTPVYSVQFTRRNLLLASGVFLP